MRDEGLCSQGKECSSVELREWKRKSGTGLHAGGSRAQRSWLKTSVLNSNVFISNWSHVQRSKVARFRVQGLALPHDVALERGQLSSKVAGSRFRVQGVALPLDVALERGQLSSFCVVNRQFKVTPLEAVDEYSVHDSGLSIEDSKPTMAPGPKTLKYSIPSLQWRRGLKP